MTTLPAPTLHSTSRTDSAPYSARRWIPEDALLLAARIGIAATFWQSGRTKVDDQFRVTDSAIALFRDEFRLPLIPPEFAAPLAAYAEHLFPLLLVAGLFTRGAAFALMVMTLVIQCFVYPDAWPTHLSWAALLALVLRQGAGCWSLDHWLRRRSP